MTEEQQESLWGQDIVSKGKEWVKQSLGFIQQSQEMWPKNLFHKLFFLIFKNLSFHALKMNFKILNKISEIYPSKIQANQGTKLNLVSTE